MGDHNITLSASNLSGTSPSKNLILTVTPEKPLFDNEPFGPATLSSLSLWLDASDSASITHLSNAVSQWNDKSGNNNHATQATTAKKPTFTADGLNGKPSITFDGSNDSFAVTSLNISQSYTFFIAAKRVSGSSTKQYLFDGITNNSNRSLVALNKDGKIQMWASSWANSNFNTPSDSFIISAVFNSSSSSLSLNGTSVGALNTGAYSLSNGIRIGGNYVDSADYLKGSIAEFFVLDETSDANTIAKAEGYLAHKWGLAGNLPSSHPYKQSITKQPKIAISSIGTNSATVSADLLDLGGAPTSLKVLFAEPDGTVLKTPETLSGLKLWLDARI